MIPQILPHVLDHDLKFELLARWAADAGRRDRGQAFFQIDIGGMNVQHHRATREIFAVDHYA
jgi:hypothetical protein